MRLHGRDGKLLIPDTLSLNAAVVKNGVVMQRINVPLIEGVMHPDFVNKYDGDIVMLPYSVPLPDAGWSYDKRTKKFTPLVRPPTAEELANYAKQLRYDRETGGVYVMLSTGKCIVVPTDRGDARANLKHQRDQIERNERQDDDVYKFSGAFTMKISNDDMLICCQSQTRYIQQCFNIEHEVIKKIYKFPPEIKTMDEVFQSFANILI